MAQHCALRLTRRYDAPTGDVWAALVDADARLRWFGNPEASFRTVDEGRVLEVDLGDSLARIELTDEGHATKLVLDHVRIPAALGMRFMRNWTSVLARFEREVAR